MERRSSVDEALTALRTVISRHESLRSLYSCSADGPVQKVVGDVALDVAIIELGDRSVDSCVDAVARRLRRGHFDSARDLPLRVALITHDEAPVAVVISVSQMAVDGWSFHLVMSELRHLLEGFSNSSVPEPRQPLDRAEFERSEAGARREQATLDYWRTNLDGAPQVLMEKTSTPDDRPRDWAQLESAAVARAAHIFAQRTGAAAGTILLASVARLLAELAGQEEALLRVIVSTRFEPQDRGYIGAMNQNALFRAGIGHDEYDDYLRHAASRALASYRRCEADPRKVEALISRCAEQRGFVPQGWCFFNDVRFCSADRRYGAALATFNGSPAAFEADLASTRLKRLDRPGRQVGAKFFLFLGRLDDACRLTLAMDPEFLGELSAEGFLGKLESSMVQKCLSTSALDPSA